MQWSHGRTLTVLVAAFALVTCPYGIAQDPGDGSVGVTVGGPFDVLLINGSAGGPLHRVNVAINQPITFQMLQPPTTVAPAAFNIFGFIGVPGPGDVSVLPLGLGTTLFPLCPIAPSPLLFTLTDNFGLGLVGSCGQILGSSPTPWSFTFIPGLPFETSFALQGGILDPSAPLGASITNAVVIRGVDPNVRVIYSKIPGDPTSVIPGALDLMGNPAVTEFRAFENLIGSPDGSRWLIKGRTQLGSDLETMLMLGGDTAGAIFAQEGQPVHGGAPGELYDFLGSGVGRFNDFNDFAYSARARGGVAGTLQKVIRVIGGVGTIVTQQGAPLIGLLDLAPNPSGDELVGNSVGSVHLLDDGTVGTQDSTITNLHSSRRPAIFYDDVAFHQSNVTMVTGLDGVTAETWATLDANDFRTTPDGAHWAAVGRIVAPAPSDAVLVVDGAVVLQEGNAIPGEVTVMSSIFNIEMAGDGAWLARGATAAGGDYAVRSAALVAETGNPITPGSGENWGDTFVAFNGNRVGDWILVGNTDSASSASDEVLVVNGQTVLVREGDPVDLDRNGLFDDDVFIGRGNDALTAFSANNAFISDDRFVYFFASLRDSAGNDLNSNPSFSTPLAFLRVPVVAP